MKFHHFSPKDINKKEMLEVTEYVSFKLIML